MRCFVVLSDSILSIAFWAALLVRVPEDYFPLNMQNSYWTYSIRISTMLVALASHERFTIWCTFFCLLW